MKTMFLTAFDNARHHELDVLIAESQNGMRMPNNQYHNYGFLKDFTDEANLYSHFIANMEEKPHEIERLVIYGHGGMDGERKGVFFGGEILYTPLELHNKLLPILKKFPNIKQIDLLACNLGVEHNPGVSYASEFAGYLKESVPREIDIRTFMPSSPETQELFFETESKEILREYGERERPPHVMPHQHFAITEYTHDKLEKKQEIIKQGMKDIELFDDIMDRLHSVACSLPKTDDKNYQTKLNNASAALAAVKLDVENKFLPNLSPDEKPLCDPLVEFLNTPCTSLCSKKIFAYITEAEELRSKIDTRENKWSREQGCIKHSGHLNTVEKCLRVVSPSNPLLCQPPTSEVTKASPVEIKKSTPEVSEETVNPVSFHIPGVAKALITCGILATKNNESNTQDVTTKVEVLPNL